jgi:hypothetical protein
VCMKLLGVIMKMCVTETYTRVRVGKSWSDMCLFRNGLKGDGLSPLLFTFDLEYAITLACNYMVNMVSWVILIMLIYWEEA